MTTLTRPGRRAASAVVLVIGGGALAAATWASGDHGLAVGLVGYYLATAGAAYWWAGGRGDVAAIMRAGGDERQQGMDRDATALTGIAMSLAAIAGAVIEVARTGSPGDFGIMCAVGGVAYVVSISVIRLRR